jgi:HD-like signal output (HDOD) protein
LTYKIAFNVHTKNQKLFNLKNGGSFTSAIFCLEFLRDCGKIKDNQKVKYLELRNRGFVFILPLLKGAL